MWSSSKKEVDIEKRFGIRNFIDRREHKAHCLLCFVDFNDDDCDDHINSEFHETLAKVTEKLKDQESIGNYCDKSVCNGESSCQSNAFEIVNPSMSSAEERVDLNAFAKQNNMHYNKVNKQAVCDLCNIYISGNIQSMSEHVDGSAHKKMKFRKDKKLPKKKTADESKSYKAIPFEIFYESIGVIVNEGIVDAVFINSKYFIASDSFVLLKKINAGPFYRCEACDEIFLEFENAVHLHTYSHLKYNRQHLVVELENEFIREIKPRTLFQCGFCNEYCTSWSLMQQHLKTSQHRASRQKSEMMALDLLMNNMETEYVMPDQFARMFSGSF